MTFTWRWLLPYQKQQVILHAKKEWIIECLLLQTDDLRKSPMKQFSKPFYGYVHGEGFQLMRVLNFDENIRNNARLMPTVHGVFSGNDDKTKIDITIRLADSNALLIPIYLAFIMIFCTLIVLSASGFAKLWALALPIGLYVFSVLSFWSEVPELKKKLEVCSIFLK